MKWVDCRMQPQRCRDLGVGPKMQLPAHCFGGRECPKTKKHRLWCFWELCRQEGCFQSVAAFLDNACPCEWHEDSRENTGFGVSKAGF